MSIKETVGQRWPAISLKYLGMESRIYCFIAVFIAYWAFALTVPAVHDVDLTSEEKKILEDCRNSDYKSYISCLKREKRHHSHPSGLLQYDANCMDACMTKCREEDVLHTCHEKCSYCLKRTKLKHQIIAEYESECVSGKCTNATETDKNQAINITTHIDVHNYMNGSTGTTIQSQPPIMPIIVAPRVAIDFQLLHGCQYMNVWPCDCKCPQPCPPPCPVPPPCPPTCPKPTLCPPTCIMPQPCPEPCSMPPSCPPPCVAYY